MSRVRGITRRPAVVPVRMFYLPSCPAQSLIHSTQGCEISVVHLPIRTVATAVKAMCKYCGTVIVCDSNQYSQYFTFVGRLNFSSFTSRCKLLATVCCDADEESSHAPSEERVLLFVCCDTKLFCLICFLEKICVYSIVFRLARKAVTKSDCWLRRWYLSVRQLCHWTNFREVLYFEFFAEMCRDKLGF